MFCPKSTSLLDVNQQEYQCLWNTRAIAYCKDGSGLTDGCSQLTPFSDGDCTRVENFKPFTNLDIGTRYGPDSRCIRVEGEQFKREHLDRDGVGLGGHAGGGGGAAHFSDIFKAALGVVWVRGICCVGCAVPVLVPVTVRVPIPVRIAVLHVHAR